MTLPINFYDLTWENCSPGEPNEHALSRWFSRHNKAFACFISSRQDFPTNKARGTDHLQQYDFLGKDLTVTSEIIYRKIPEFEKFKGKKILVIGAGPTTNWYDWNPDEYDYIFSCNHFFLN